MDKNIRINESSQYRQTPILRLSLPFSVIGYITLFFIVVLVFLPIALAILYSFLPSGLIPNIRSFRDITDNFTLQGYRDVFDQLPFLRILGNSIFVSLVSTLLQLLVAFITAYALIHWNYPGKNYIIGFIIVVMIIPSVALIIPNYITISNLGMLNRFSGVIIPNIANAYGIFLMRQYFRNVPKSLIEACRLDGANEFRILWYIYLPICKPAVIVLFVILLVANWNDFHWPMLVLYDPDRLTLPLALVRLRDEAVIEWRPTIAGSLMTMIPVAVAYTFIQRQLIDAFAATVSRE